MPQAEKLGEDAKAPAAAAAQELVFDDNALAAGLLGERDWVLRLLERELGIRARARGNRVLLRGAEARVQHGRRALEDLYALLRGGRPLPLRAHDVRAALEVAARDDGSSLRDVYAEVLVAEGGRRRICTKNPAQRRYLELMRRHAVVLAIGPAGTGKTYLAMAMALAALDRGDVSRVILTRPAVEAGEKLGFLPGSMTEKVDPYLRPLYDALHDMMSMDRTQRMMERGAIEVAPLAFMRGRTLNGCFVILDEAQNTTPEQMKMFLTRLGYDAKAVVTGDVTQVDLPSGQQSGLADARRVLDGVPEIGFMHFSQADVVRHPVVQSIIRAYELAARGRGA